MRQFLGIIIWMGLMHLPKLRDYWSRKGIYENGIRKIMSRNRFEIVLTMFHLSDNEQPVNQEDSLHKISKFFNILEKNSRNLIFQKKKSVLTKAMYPFEDVYIFGSIFPTKDINMTSRFSNSVLLEDIPGHSKYTQVEKEAKMFLLPKKL